MIAYLECPKKKGKEISVVEGCMGENCKHLSAEITRTEEWLLKEEKRISVKIQPVYYRCCFKSKKR